jgi:hypothetical protein
MAQWIVENWFLIVALAAGAGSIAYAIYKFAGLPTEQQVKNIKEWLLLAVTTAEKELGGGTGQLKLRYVYDLFVSKYPVAAKVISFETFSTWVDEALENMKNMLKSNAAAREFVSSGMNE